MRLLCVGDIGLAQDNLAEWERLLPVGAVAGDGLRVLLNWELPIGETINPVPRSSGPRLLAPPDSPRAIRRWSPGFATLATNHILDAGEKGLANTIGALHRAGFTTVGAGRSQEEIARPLLWETVEGTLAVVNWVFPETHPDWMSVPGPNCWPGLDGAQRTIQELRCGADWVLIVVHWSDELLPYPRPEDRAIARELAQMGADMIVGHHPHVVRGMELIGSCPVFYSIGNFYFSDIPRSEDGLVERQAPRNREALGVEVSFRRGQRPEYRLLSFWQTRERVASDSLRRAARRMQHTSQPLRRLQGSVYAEWYAVKRARFDKWGYRLHFGLWQLGGRGLVRYGSRLLGLHLRGSP